MQKIIVDGKTYYTTDPAGLRWKLSVEANKALPKQVI